MLVDLEQQHDQPDDAEGHVQTVGADQREERGQEAATGRARAFVDQVQELIEFEVDEASAQQTSDDQPEDGVLGRGGTNLL